jgi:hypothetical protein
MSVLKPENSMIAGLAVVGLVIANYNLHNGPVSSVALSPSEAGGSGSLTTTNRKAGWTSLIMVAGIALLAKDGNVCILGTAAIIAMHSSYLHSLASSPAVNAIVTGPAAAGAYVPGGG